MGGIANNPQVQNAMQMAGSLGQPQQPRQPQGGFPQFPGFSGIFPGRGQIQPFNPNLNTIPYEGPDPNQTVPMPPPGTLAYNAYQQTGRLPTYGEISQPVVEPLRPGSVNPQIQGMSRGTPPYGPTSQEAYNRFTATAKPVAGGSLPSYEQFVQNINTQNTLGPQRGLGGLQLDRFRRRLG